MDVNKSDFKISLNSNVLLNKNRLSLKVYSKDFKINGNSVEIPVMGYSNKISNGTNGLCIIRSNLGNQIIVKKINNFYINLKQIDKNFLGYLSFTLLDFEFKENIDIELLKLFPINSILSFYQWSIRDKKWKSILNFNHHQKILNITKSLNYLIKCSNHNNFKLELQVNKLLEAI